MEEIHLEIPAEVSEDRAIERFAEAVSLGNFSSALVHASWAELRFQAREAIKIASIRAMGLWPQSGNPDADDDPSW